MMWEDGGHIFIFFNKRAPLLLANEVWSFEWGPCFTCMNIEEEHVPLFSFNGGCMVLFLNWAIWFEKNIFVSLEPSGYRYYVPTWSLPNCSSYNSRDVNNNTYGLQSWTFPHLFHPICAQITIQNLNRLLIYLYPIICLLYPNILKCSIKYSVKGLN